MTETSILDLEVEELLVKKVDDLVKFHIVSLLHEDPTIAGDAEFFSNKLGFRSPERTEQALDELVSSGILRRQKAGRPDRVVYGLRKDHKLMKLLDRIFDMDTNVGKYGEILSRLAAQSVVRAGMAAGVLAS